jgi:hypothetical protein
MKGGSDLPDAFWNDRVFPRDVTIVAKPGILVFAPLTDDGG